MRGYVLVILMAAVFAVCLSANAEAKRVFYVDAKNGDDANPGTSPQQAFKTISKAAGVIQIQGGDKLIVRPGVYYERPVFRDLGSSSDSPVWIVAEPRGAATISAAWKEAALGKVVWKSEGDGIYSTPRSLTSLFGWTEDKHFLFRYMKVEHLKTRKVPTWGTKPTWGPHGVVIGPEAGFACEGGRIYVRLPGGENPNGKPMMFSTPSWGEAGRAKVVQVVNSPYVIIDGFRIQGSGTYGIACYSPNAVVRNCIFEYCREGVGLSDDSLVEWCEYAYPGFYDFAEETRQLNDGKLAVYPLCKEYHPGNWYEGSLAYALVGKKDDPSPRRVEVRYSYIHDVFDGLVLGTFDDSEAHHNVFLHCYDNCVELEAWTNGRSKNLRFHHNLLLSCPGGPISHQHPEILEGPHYVYRNVVVGYDDHGWNPWVVIKSKVYGKGRGFYYYHNLFWVESAEPYWNEKSWPQEWLKTFEFKNNIFVFTKNMRRPTGPRGTEELFKAAGNIVVAANSDEAIRKALLRNGGLFFENLNELLMEDPSKLDFTLQAGSPAIDNGVRIPGFNDDAKGMPDVGPFEFGEEVSPDWPRPRKTVFNISPPELISGKQEPPKIVVFDL